jgi:hypothetical protein
MNVHKSADSTTGESHANKLQSHSDDVRNGFLIKPEERKWNWLRARAVLLPLITLALIAKAAATPAYPLKPSANGRYVVDSNNVPFLIIGDAPHSILANLNNADAATYLANRGMASTHFGLSFCATATPEEWARKALSTMDMMSMATILSRAH